MGKVRVLRLIEYIGPEDWVARVLDKSIHGIRDFGDGGTIQVHTLRDFCFEIDEPLPIDEALEGSIKKWEKVVNEGAEEKGRLDCPLCAKHFGESCTGCIVQSKTGKRGCSNTPYVDWRNHLLKEHPGELKKVHCSVCTKRAQEMVDFLRDLRKEVKSG